MKKFMVLAVVAIFVLAAATSFAAISNTRHNLTTTSLFTTHTTSGTQTLCGFCHIPHGGNTSTSGLPLWARRTAGSGTYSITYTPYGSTVAGSAGTTLSGTTVPAVPGPMSLACLSCHDGAWGLGIITKNGFDNPELPFQGNVVSGTDSRLDPTKFTGAYNPVIGSAATGSLTNDHPVGLDYRGTAASKAGLKDATGGEVVGTYASYPLFNGKLECGSCHDPHTENNKFLRTPSANQSVFCQECHSNK